MTSPVRPRWPQPQNPFDRIGSGARNMRTDAQAFVPDSDYVRKGAEIDDSESNITRTLLGNGDVFYTCNATSGDVLVTLPQYDTQVGRFHYVKRIDSSANMVKVTAAPLDSGAVGMEVTATHSIGVFRGVRTYFSDGEGWRTTGLTQEPGGEVTSGTYTPTLTGVANISATGARECHFMRVGSEVTVAGGLTANAVAAGGTLTAIGISLPVASDFSEFDDCAGTGRRALAVETGVVDPDTANNRATLRFNASATTTTNIVFSFTYRIR